jgi:hypothetical protein
LEELIIGIAEANEEAERRHQESVRQKEQENKEAERRHQEEMGQKKQEMEMAQKCIKKNGNRTEITSMGHGSKADSDERFNK